MRPNHSLNHNLSLVPLVLTSNKQQLIVAGGLTIIIAAFLPLPNGLIATLIVGVLSAVVLIPVAYSYLLWRAELR